MLIERTVKDVFFNPSYEMTSTGDVTSALDATSRAQAELTIDATKVSLCVTFGLCGNGSNTSDPNTEDGEDGSEDTPIPPSVLINAPILPAVITAYIADLLVDFY